MGYKYFIKYENAGWYFGLYPSNHNEQAIAVSELYNSYEIARSKLNEFKILMANSQNRADMFEIYETKTESGFKRFKFELKPNKYGIVLYRQYGYDKKSECKKGIMRVINNYDAPLK